MDSQVLTKPCNGPLHKGASLPLDVFFGYKTCSACLNRNRIWKHMNPDVIKKQNSWDNPDNRFRQNMRRLHIYEAQQMKKEGFEPFLKVGMGWGNYYVKGKRSWKFVIGTGDDEGMVIAKWS